MNIDVVERAGPDGDTAYFLLHDYDLDIFTGVPGSGPFASQREAEEAADRLSDALSCVSD